MADDEDIDWNAPSPHYLWTIFDMAQGGYIRPDSWGTPEQAKNRMFARRNLDSYFDERYPTTDIDAVGRWYGPQGPAVVKRNLPVVIWIIEQEAGFLGERTPKHFVIDGETMTREEAVKRFSWQAPEENR